MDVLKLGPVLGDAMRIVPEIQPSVTLINSLIASAKAGTAPTLSPDDIATLEADIGDLSKLAQDMTVALA